MQPGMGGDFGLMQLAKMTVNRAIVIAVNTAVADRINPILTQVVLIVVGFTIMRVEVVGILVLKITARTLTGMLPR